MGDYTYRTIDPDDAELAALLLFLPDFSGAFDSDSPQASIASISACVSRGDTAAILALDSRREPAALFLVDLCRANGLAFGHQYVRRSWRGESFAIVSGAVDYFMSQVWPDCRGLFGLVPDLPEFRMSRIAAAGAGGQRSGRLRGFFDIRGAQADAIVYQMRTPDRPDPKTAEGTPHR